MNVLLISTVRHNPGDEFIRLGQEWLLSDLAPKVNFVIGHKHDPRTLFEDFQRGRRNPHRLLAPWLYRIHSRRSSGVDLLAEADLVVFAGTPFIWRQNTPFFPSTSANAEWVVATWDRLFTEFPQKPVLNLAAGTSLNEGQDRSVITKDARVRRFLERALERSAVTTARDRVTSQILADLGGQVPVLPCTSLWAAAGAGLVPRNPEYVAVNVMPRAVHTARGKAAPAMGWRRTIRAVVRELAADHPVHLICHSRSEHRIARRWFPNHETTYSEDPVVLLEAYGRALFTVSNRVHGAGGAASFCRPALGIGGDSRMSLMHEFGLPTMAAPEATVEKILETCALLMQDYRSHERRLTQLTVEGRTAYLDLIGEALG